ncbi:MAG TPA: VOC family protein [Micromonosporaceae bacterium]|nr:VOC family protein [Micromonosporaceae bacterium]
MSILGVDHVELFVGDTDRTANYLCSALGFRVEGRGGPQTGLPDQESVLLGQGDIQILVTAGRTAAHPATEYVARHGDGVAVVAFGTVDASAAFAEAVAQGATAVTPPDTHQDGESRVVTATVSGFGDVVHQLVERHGPGRELLPGRIVPVPAATAPPTAVAPTSATATAPPATAPTSAAATASPDGSDLLLAVDHAAICLPAGTLEPTVGFYRSAFGFAEIFEEYIQVGEQGMESKVVQSPSGEVTFTLIQPDTSRTPGQIDEFLTRHGGAGVQHLAFRTGDIISAVRTFASRGVAFAMTPGSYYDVLEQRLGSVDLPVSALREAGVLVDQDHWGQMFQIFTQSMHDRRTLFLELIERHGARTFGSSNIKALYEAKERELAGLREITEAGLG